jgi:hypothetical protein
MSHGTHNDTISERTKSQVSFQSSFWLIVILVGLFIAALNFINVMGKGEEGKEGKAETEEMHGAKAEGENKAMKEEAKPAATEAEHKDAKEEAPKPAAAPAEHK